MLHKRVCIELGDFPGAIPLDRAVPSPDAKTVDGNIRKIQLKTLCQQELIVFSKFFLAFDHFSLDFS